MKAPFTVHTFPLTPEFPHEEDDIVAESVLQKHPEFDWDAEHQLMNKSIARGEEGYWLLGRRRMLPRPGGTYSYIQYFIRPALLKRPEVKSWYDRQWG